MDNVNVMFEDDDVVTIDPVMVANSRKEKAIESPKYLSLKKVTMRYGLSLPTLIKLRTNESYTRSNGEVVPLRFKSQNPESKNKMVHEVDLINWILDPLRVRRGAGAKNRTHIVLIVANILRTDVEAFKALIAEKFVDAKVSTAAEKSAEIAAKKKLAIEAGTFKPRKAKVVAMASQ